MSAEVIKSGSREPDRYNPKPYVTINHPEWSKNATLYEVNIRQYTPEGTFKAFETHLPRLRDMGIDILWMMPVHPIGTKNRKGRLGSYYAVRDYYGINPEFGNMDDFRTLVRKIHDLGMHVIIDWVANHSAWDNPLTIEHPEWYSRSHEGNFQPTPWCDWDDIIDFDYRQPGIRQYMTEAMKFWVRETHIDGYRCDVAGFLPLDFWEQVREELDLIKPVFMLAEWESRDLHRKAFDATYSWSLYEKLKEAVYRDKGAGTLLEYLAHDVSAFPGDAFRLTFTDNHDKNSWDGPPGSNFGKGLHAAMVMASVVKGMPMVYSGQEAGLDRSLSFFEKDSIDWKTHPNTAIFRKLFTLKHANKALWNGHWGGDMVRLTNDKTEQVISFVREMESHRVVSIINFSDKEVRVQVNTAHYAGKYTELFSGEAYDLNGKDSFSLGPWNYLVLTNIPVE